MHVCVCCAHWRSIPARQWASLTVMCVCVCAHVCIIDKHVCVCAHVGIIDKHVCVCAFSWPVRKIWSQGPMSNGLPTYTTRPACNTNLPTCLEPHSDPGLQLQDVAHRKGPCKGALACDAHAGIRAVGWRAWGASRAHASGMPSATASHKPISHTFRGWQVSLPCRIMGPWRYTKGK